MPKRIRDDEASTQQSSKKPLVDKLDHSVAIVSHCTTSTHAFPSGPAAFPHGLRWTGTPWIPSPGVRASTIQKIVDRADDYICSEHMEISSIMQLGVPAASYDFTLYAVFPNLKRPIAASSDCKCLKKWQNKIMLPAMHKFRTRNTQSEDLTPTHEEIVLSSQREGIEAWYHDGDIPYQYYISGDMFQQVWNEVEKRTKQAQFAEFRDVFLVAVGDLLPSVTMPETSKQALKKTLRRWKCWVDMEEIPSGDMEICIEAQMLL